MSSHRVSVLSSVEDNVVAKTKSVKVQLKERSRDRVARQLRAMIDEGTFAAGAALPSERELSAVLEAPRDAVRNALQSLTQEGWLHPNGTTRRRLVKGVPQDEARGALGSTVVLLTAFPFDPLRLRSQNGWSEYLDQGAAAAIHENGCHLLTFHLDRMGDEWKRIVEQKPGGILVTDLFQRTAQVLPFLPQFSARSVPVVAYGDAKSVASFDRVASDHEGGGYALTQALLQHGYKRPLMLGSSHDDFYWIKVRRQGFERALSEAGLEITPLVDPQGVALPATRPGKSPSEKEAEFETRARLLSSFLIPHLTGANRADAILAASDDWVPLVMRACRLFGLEPNRDIAVTGYDNYWLDLPDRAFEPEPPLFSVDKHNEETGRKLLELLWKRKNRELDAAPQRELVTPSIVEPGQE